MMIDEFVLIACFRKLKLYSKRMEIIINRTRSERRPKKREVNLTMNNRARSIRLKMTKFVVYTSECQNFHNVQRPVATFADKNRLPREFLRCLIRGTPRAGRFDFVVWQEGRGSKWLKKNGFKGHPLLLTLVRFDIVRMTLWVTLKKKKN